MSTRLAIDSRRAITVRRRRQVDMVFVAGATAAVSAFALLGRHESAGRLAIELVAGIIGGLLIGRRARRAAPEATVTVYAARAAVQIAVAAVGLTLLEVVTGGSGGIATGLLAGTLAAAGINHGPPGLHA